jgi:hypothetical protein
MDIGTRVIVAISLEPRETVRVHHDENGEWREERYMSNDPRDLLGPPYSVAEHVFAEYGLGGSNSRLRKKASKMGVEARELLRFAHLCACVPLRVSP